MAIAVKLRCSECSTIRFAELKVDDKELVCPACGRRLQNLTAAEHQEIETIQKKQRMFSIISLVLFVLAVVCLILWIGGPDSWVSKEARPEPNIGTFLGMVVCSVASLVLAILASLKRYVIEF
jgi:DNA-directed RNA polymerase subunit RPC12/RpoP